ncbi:hypothetical protein BaRGS_00017139, partial [Batillaria attramentaria]
SEFLIWMDASVRWNNAASFDRIFQRAERQGVQCALGGGSIAVRTAVSTFRFYGDQTCQYSSFREIEANCEVYHNDVFVREAIVEPWLSCAFNRTCMCVKNFGSVRGCSFRPPRRYNRCHRFDQSSLGIILSKLYMEKETLLTFPPSSVAIRRGHRMRWFKP